MADHAVSDHKGKRQAAKSSEFTVTYKGCLDDERDAFPMDVVTHQVWNSECHSAIFSNIVTRN